MQKIIVMMFILMWSAEVAHAYDFDALTSGENNSGDSDYTSGQVQDAYDSYSKASGRINRDRVAESGCRQRFSRTEKYCKLMKTKNGGIFTQSDKERCESYLYDAISECKKGHNTKAELYRCLADCSALRDDNGGILSSSSRQKCNDQCYYKH